MKNSLANLFNTLHPIASSSGIRPQTEGLVSNIQIDNSGMAIITLLTDKFPLPAELISTEEIFEMALHVGEMYFAVESADSMDVEIPSYLQWAARHVEKSDPFAAALIRNASLTARAENEYGILFNDTGDCGYFDKICEKMSKAYSICFGRDIRIFPEMCAVDLAKESDDVYRYALNEASINGVRRNSPAAEGGAGKKSSTKRASGNDEKSAYRYKAAAGGAAAKASLIWGKMNSEIKPVPMSELNNESGFVVFQGSVFGMDSRSVSGGSKTLVKYNVSDKTNSIKCFQFMDPAKAEEFIQTQSKGYLQIYASVGYDFQFEKDLVAKVIGISQAKEPPDMKDHSQVKRVELHCHTKMSSKDSICDIKDLVRRAAHYGHEAIAITDHGVVQAFPDARSAHLELKKKGKNIKIIYGMECYLADDGGCLAYMCEDKGIENGFVGIAVAAEGDVPGESRVQAFTAVRFNIDPDGEFVPSDSKHWRYSGESGAGYDEELFRAMGSLAGFIGDSYVAADNVLHWLSFLRYEGFCTQNDRMPPVKFYGGAIDTAKIKVMLPESGIAAKVIFQDNCQNIFPDEMSDLDQKAFDAGLVLIDAFRTIGSSSLDALNKLAGKLEPAEFLGNADRNFHCVLLSKDEAGLYGIYRLVSESHIRFIYRDRPRIPRSCLEFFRTGIVLGSACEAGEVFQSAIDLYDKCGCSYEAALASLEFSEIIRKAAFYDYLEIQPIGNNEFMLRQGERKGMIVPPKYKSREDLKNLNRLVCELSVFTGIPLCATCDVHFLKPQDEIMRRIMQYDSGYSDALLQPPLYYRTTHEMLDEFGYLGEATAYKIVVENPVALAGRIKPDMKPFAEGSYPPVIDSAEREVDTLTWTTAKELYEKDGVLPEIVRKRVIKELKSIIGNGFAIMYYIAHKLVHKSNEDGYLVGSRGSVGSSLVARLCGITEVNPLEPHYLCGVCKYSEFDDSGKYNSGYDLPDKVCPCCGSSMGKDGQDIPFETFLGFEGEKQPDIDLNFSGEYQPVAHKFIEDMFGSSHTFRAGTITGFAEKNTAMMVRKYAEGNGIYMTGAESARLAAGLAGVKRTTSQHPGGIVVVPKDREIYDFTPVQCPADKTENGIITTHFDFNSLHDTILKLDILGHDDPTMLKVLGDMTGVDVNAITVTDEKIMRLLKGSEVLNFVTDPGNNCGTLGLPELGTFMARGMVEETQPSRFYDLVQLMGLSHGTDVWNGNARDLIKDGVCNVSEVIGCRDGIMTTLVHRGLNPKVAFGIMEGVRKGKGLTADQEKAMNDNNVPAWYIESCKKIKYMFPKAHAVAYTISSLRIAWFKIYRPVQYYCAFFTVRADDFDYRLMCAGIDVVRHYMKIFIAAFKTKDRLQVHIMGKEEEFSIDKSKKIYYILELVAEMHCRGIDFSPLDIFKSDATRFIMESATSIRPPLNSLPSLSAVAANNIVNAREQNERFISREDFASKAGLGDSMIQLLDMQGCLESLPKTTQMDLFSFMG
ncbi:MAG: PolC-type DNA polymerase III [Saccharofermentanales bacterium]